MMKRLRYQAMYENINSGYDQSLYTLSPNPAYSNLPNAIPYTALSPLNPQHIKGYFAFRPLVIAPQCVSSAATPLSPILFGFQGSSKASNMKTLYPHFTAAQTPSLKNLSAFFVPAFAIPKSLPPSEGHPVSPVHNSGIFAAPPTTSEIC